MTSNVEGQFEAAGFPEDRILEQHGSVHRYQCTRPCSDFLSSDESRDLDIDLETITARGALPRCPECGAIARPNVLMFEDPDWVPRITREQERRYRSWLASIRGRRLLVLEPGAGSTIATIRVLGERLATDADEPVLPLRLGAVDALRRIEEKLPVPFREAARAATSLEADRMSRICRTIRAAGQPQAGSGYRRNHPTRCR